MKCPKCFKDNQPSAKFCAYCGGALIGSVANPQSKTQLSNFSPNKTMIVQGSNLGIANSNEVIIGRGNDNDIVVSDGSVSTRHAKIFLDNGEVFIEDLRSMNGTFVNGKRIYGKTEIKASDRINLGSHMLNTNHNYLVSLFSRSNMGGMISDGALKLSFNPNWVGKIIYFILVILLLMPWVTISVATVDISLTAFDFALNRLPAGLTEKSTNFEGYGGIHIVFMILSALTLIGLLMNFIRTRITESFNFVNIISLIIFVISCIVPFIPGNSMGNNEFVKLIVSYHFTFAAFLFVLLIFVSIFEGLIEKLIKNKN
ncbi:MAG: FHA domain-containing protein [Ignavibacteria bacterium]|nr:FHA domain-containing protein [Ignavibacteria bacterium]